MFRTNRDLTPNAVMTVMGTGLLFFLCAAFFLGCAKDIPVVDGSLMRSGIVADGNDMDWPVSPPLYVDEKNRAGIRVMNDRQTLCVLVTIAGQPLIQQFAARGVRLTLDTLKEGTRPFSIEIQAQDPFFGHGQEKKDTDLPEPPPPRDENSRPPESNSAGGAQAPLKDAPGSLPPDLLAHRTVLITYPHSSGEMEMTVAQAGEYGIELGMKTIDFSRLVFEANIRLDAVLPDETRDFNSPVVLCLSTTGHGQGFMPDKKSTNDMPGNGQGGPGGGPMGGGPGKGGPPMQRSGKTNAAPFEAMVKFNLAGMN